MHGSRGASGDRASQPLGAFFDSGFGVGALGAEGSFLFVAMSFSPLRSAELRAPGLRGPSWIARQNQSREPVLCLAFQRIDPWERQSRRGWTRVDAPSVVSRHDHASRRSAGGGVRCWKIIFSAMNAAFIAWVIAIAAVATFGQGGLAPAALAILEPIREVPIHVE